MLVYSFTTLLRPAWDESAENPKRKSDLEIFSVKTKKWVDM